MTDSTSSPSQMPAGGTLETESAVSPSRVGRKVLRRVIPDFSITRRQAVSNSHVDAEIPSIPSSVNPLRMSVRDPSVA